MSNADYGAEKDRKVDLGDVRNRFLPPGLSSGAGQVTQNGFVKHKKAQRKGAEGERAGN